MKGSGADHATERYRSSLLRYRMRGCWWGFMLVCVCASAICARGFVCTSVSELHRPANTRYTLRATLSHLLVAALCGTTRPPWFHSWLHWLIFARCPRTLERTCTYAARRSSFNTHRGGGCCWIQGANLENLGNEGEGKREFCAFMTVRVIFDIFGKMRFRKRWNLRGCGWEVSRLRPSLFQGIMYLNSIYLEK